MNVKLIGLGDLDEATGTRECFFEVNGFPRSVKRLDETASSNVVVRPKADSSQIGAVGAPMPGVVVDVKVAVGDAVSAGDPMVVLSAMKMETVCAASIDGVASGRVESNQSMVGRPKFDFHAGERRQRRDGRRAPAGRPARDDQGIEQQRGRRRRRGARRLNPFPPTFPLIAWLE